MLSILGNVLTPTKLLWLLRQVLQFGGIYLVGTGRADADQVADATRQILDLVGSVSALIGFTFNVIATFRPKVVTGGESVGLPAIKETIGTLAAREVVQTAKETIANKPTLWESWFGKR